MKTRTPRRHTKVANEWEEIDVLRDRLLYWLYGKEDFNKARPYANQLNRLLSRADPDNKAVLGAECRSLVHEAKGDLGKAIKYREREIRLIRRLHRLAHGKPYGEAALEGYDYEDLSDRLDLLAVLYQSAGDLEKAIRTLRKSKKLCAEHGLKFDGDDVLQECLAARRSAVPTAANGAHNPLAKRTRRA